MKTLFISSNPPNEWRNHAHIITWLKSEGLDIEWCIVFDNTLYALNTLAEKMGNTEKRFDKADYDNNRDLITSESIVTLKLEQSNLLVVYICKTHDDANYYKPEDKTVQLISFAIDYAVENNLFTYCIKEEGVVIPLVLTKSIDGWKLWNRETMDDFMLRFIKDSPTLDSIP